MKPIAIQQVQQQQQMNMPPQPTSQQQQQPTHGGGHRKIVYHQGPTQQQQQQQPTHGGGGGHQGGQQQSLSAQGYHPSYHRMHHPGQQPQQQPGGSVPPTSNPPQGMVPHSAPALPSTSRLADLFEALRQEFDLVSENTAIYKSQRDELEHKLSTQIHELSLFQQSLYELEKTHQKIKLQYEEEISRLKRELERLGGRYDTYYSQTNGEHVAKRMRAEEPPSQQQSMNPSSAHHAYYSQYSSNQPPSNSAYSKSPYPPTSGALNQQQQPPPHTGQSQHAGQTQHSMVPSSSVPQHVQQQQSTSHAGAHQRQSQGVTSSQQHHYPSHHPSQQLYSAQQTQSTSSTVAASIPPITNPTPNVPVSQAHLSTSATSAAPVSSSTPAQPPTSNPLPERITGICDLEPDHIGPEWRKEGADWIVTYNPRSTVLQQDRLDVNMVYNFDHDSVVCVVRFSPCGKFLATGCNHHVFVYDIETGTKIAALTEEKTEQQDLYIRAICFSPDSALLATGAENRVIRLWDLSTKTIKTTLTGHELDTYSLDWSKDGRFLYSGSGDKTIRVWDVEQSTCIRVLSDEVDAPNTSDEPKESGVSSLSLNPTYPRCLAAGSLDRIIRIWDISTGRLLERFEGHKESVYSVAFSPDGTSLVSGAFDRTVRVWDLSTSTLNYFANHSNVNNQDRSESPSPKPTITTTCRHIFSGHKDFVLSVAFAGLNAQLGRVDENGDPVATPGGDALAEVEWIVSASKDRTVTFWNGGRGTSNNGLIDPHTVAQFTLQGHRKSVISVALAPIGGLFATGSGDHRVRVWRVSADHNGLASLPPAGPAHHSATSSQASMTPAATTTFMKPSSVYAQASSISSVLPTSQQQHMQPTYSTTSTAPGSVQPKEKVTHMDTQPDHSDQNENVKTLPAAGSKRTSAENPSDEQVLEEPSPQKNNLDPQVSSRQQEQNECATLKKDNDLIEEDQLDPEFEQVKNEPENDLPEQKEA